MRSFLLLSSAFLLMTQMCFAQGSNCASAAPFCTGSTITFPASTDTEAEVGPDYDCLFGQPNPAWYFLQIDQSGPIDIELSNSEDYDIDFVCWGPFSDLTNACSNLNGNVVDCSFEIDATEYVSIPNAVSGQFYMLMITNYDGFPTEISAVQTNNGGTTNCDIVEPPVPCDIVTFTAVPGACDASFNYTLTGTFTYQNNPGTGTVTVAANNGTQTYTQSFNPPFVNGQTYNFSIPNIPGNGAATTVVVGFTADPACNQTVVVNAPQCDPNACDILTLTAAPQPCDDNFNYEIRGTVSYLNNPGTGTLVVTASNGSSVYTASFNPPFTDNQLFSFSFPDVPANGAVTTVVAAFSDDASCTQTFTYTAPSCSCEIDAVFNALPAVLSVDDPVTQMLNQSVNADTYLWEFGDGTTSTLENPQHVYPAGVATNYEIWLTVENSMGCMDSARMIITVNENLVYYIPNTFTPDGDEANQYFQPVFTSGFDPYNYKMQIFNRWGETIFETNDPAIGWDGTYNGKIVREGSYTWKVEFKRLNIDERIMETGHVNVIR